MPQVELKQPQIIKTHHMIRMFVGVNYRVNNSDSFSQQLLTKIGRGVDQQISVWQAHNCAGPRTFVPRIIALADRATATNRRNSHRSACSQEDHLSREINRKR